MEDAMIVGLLFKRSENGLSEIKSKYGAAMMKVAENITGSREDAEEVLNDVLAEIWRSIPPAYPTSLGAYVLRAARNTAVSRVRTMRHRSDARLLPIEELEPILPDAEEMDDSGEILHALEVFLGGLDAVGRDIFLRRYWASESVKSIASHLGMTQVAVSGRLNRMRRKFAEILQKEGVSL